MPSTRNILVTAAIAVATIVVLKMLSSFTAKIPVLGPYLAI
jgi:hypothetical protein